LVVLLVLVMTMAGCTDGGDISVGVVIGEHNAQFLATTTPADENAVRLRSTTVDGDLVTLEVAIGGPTTSGDLYSFAFDLVLSDASVATYVDGSAVFGDALTLSGGQGSTVLCSQSGDRIVVGVSKTGGGSGNDVAAGELAVVRLTLQVLDEGTTSITIEGSPGNPLNPGTDPVALDSAGAVVPSVRFDSAPALLLGV
jgi:hypothetical protein